MAYLGNVRLVSSSVARTVINAVRRRSFGRFSDIAARATHLRFYGERCAVPDEKDLVTFEDEEMKSAEKVDILLDYMKVVGCGVMEWKRVEEVVFTEKWW